MKISVFENIQRKLLLCEIHKSEKYKRKTYIFLELTHKPAAHVTVTGGKEGRGKGKNEGERERRKVERKEWEESERRKGKEIEEEKRKF